MQKVLSVPEVGADASYCTLCGVRSAAATQILDLVLHDGRLALNTLTVVIT